MVRIISGNNQIEIKYIKFILFLFSSNFNKIPGIIQLPKNYILDLWNSWANSLEELFFILYNEADRK
jgi:hypothetical protein